MNTSHRLCRTFSGVLFMCSLQAHAASTDSITLDAVLERALKESPLVQQLEQQVASIAAEGMQVGTLQNPELDAEVRFPRAYKDSRGSNEVAVSLSQPLRSSDFGVRNRIAHLFKKTADAEKKLELLRLSQTLRLSYVKAWALARRERELSGYVSQASRIESAVNKASESGFLSSGEGLLFTAEAKKARYQLSAVTADLKRARAILSKDAGFVVSGILKQPAFSKLPTEAELLNPTEGLPAARRATLAKSLAQAQLKQARLDSFPTFAPRIVYEKTGESTEYVGIGLSIDLPFFDRNQSERLRKNAELASAEAVSRYANGEGLQQEVRALRESLEASAALVQGYEQEILPAIREALSAEESLFNSGQGSIFRVWQALRELSAAETEALERLVNLHADRAELVALTGIDF